MDRYTRWECAKGGFPLTEIFPRNGTEQKGNLENVIGCLANYSFVLFHVFRGQIRKS